MKGNPAVIEALNWLLADELAAQNQYLAHYSALENWGFSDLARLVKDRAADENKHAQALTRRILALEGVPTVGTIGEINFTVGDLQNALTFDAIAEQRAITSYNTAVNLCDESDDNATLVILNGILSEETEHLNEIEGWQAQIAMMGLGAFLSARIK